MLIDFSTPYSSLKSLGDITTLSLDELKCLSEEIFREDQSNQRLESYINRELFINKKELYVTFFHITTVPDPNSLENYGLLPLKQALKSDTFIKRFLGKYNIHFDLENNILCHENRKIPLKGYSELGYSDKGTRLYYRLNKDSNTNGFYYYSWDGPSEYSSIDVLPEFLDDTLTMLFDSGDMYESIKSDWIKQTNRYLLKAEIPLSKIEIPEVEDYPYCIASRLLDCSRLSYGDMLPTDRDIVFLNSDEIVEPHEIKKIELKKVLANK